MLCLFGILWMLGQNLLYHSSTNSIIVLVDKQCSVYFAFYKTWFWFCHLQFPPCRVLYKLFMDTSPPPLIQKPVTSIYGLYESCYNLLKLLWFKFYCILFHFPWPVWFVEHSPTLVAYLYLICGCLFHSCAIEQTEGYWGLQLDSVENFHQQILPNWCMLIFK